MGENRSGCGLTVEGDGVANFDNMIERDIYICVEVGLLQFFGESPDEFSRRATKMPSPHTLPATAQTTTMIAPLKQVILPTYPTVNQPQYCCCVVVLVLGGYIDNRAEEH